MKAKYILLWFLSKVLIKMSGFDPVCSLSVNPEIAGSCLCGLSLYSFLTPALRVCVCLCVCFSFSSAILFHVALLPFPHLHHFLHFP